MNARGPSTEPCGTPEVTGDQSETAPLRTVLWVLPDNQFYPLQDPSVDTVGPELHQQPLVRDLVEGLGEVQVDDVHWIALCPAWLSESPKTGAGSLYMIFFFLNHAESHLLKH